MVRLFTVSLFVLISTSGLLAQKKIENRDQTWLAYFNQTRITNKSGLWLDLHYRLTDDFIKENSVKIARFGYTYYLSNDVRLTAGYALARLYSSTGPAITERRPWQQIQWFEKKNRFNMMQLFRVEERYRPTIVDGAVTEDFNFNWRFRYNISLTFPLKGKTVTPGTPLFIVHNEVHINAGKSIMSNYFDQNRLFVGLGYQFTPHVNAQIGYLNVFQQLATPGQFVNVDAVRLFVFHNLDFRNND